MRRPTPRCSVEKFGTWRELGAVESKRSARTNELLEPEAADYIDDSTSECEVLRSTDWANIFHVTGILRRPRDNTEAGNEKLLEPEAYVSLIVCRLCVERAE